MSNEYYNLIKNLWNKNNNNKSFSPNDFKEKLSIKDPLFNELNVIDNNYNINYNQNGQLDEQKMKDLFIKEFEANYNSIISHLFYGILEIKSQCQVFYKTKYNFQIYCFIKLPLR